jgi:hypothetical protein
MTTSTMWTASIEAKPFAGGGHWYVVTDSDENGLGEFYGDDHEANVANLRLAAAAPDLYEALERMFVEEMDYICGRISKPATDAARAALAKARGEA